MLAATMHWFPAQGNPDDVGKDGKKQQHWLEASKNGEVFLFCKDGSLVASGLQVGARSAVGRPYFHDYPMICNYNSLQCSSMESYITG